MKKKVDLKFLKDCLDVDFKTGVLSWKARPADHFKNIGMQTRWNNSMPGKVAGSVFTPRDKRTSYLTLHITGIGHIKAHHVVFCLYHNLDYKPCLDHIDQNGLNNAVENLRESDSSRNMKNKRRYIINKTGISGVRFCETRKAWEVSIPVPNSRKKFFKRFKDFFEACCCRKSLEISLSYSENHGS